MDTVNMKTLNPLLDPMESFDINYRDEVLGTNPPPVLHNHNVYELVFFISATLDCFVRNIRYPVGDNMVLLIRPYDLHAFHYQPGVRYTRFVLSFSPEFIRPLVLATGAGQLLPALEALEYQRVVLNPEGYGRIHSLFWTLYRAKTDKRLSPVLQRAALQSSLLALLLEVYAIAGSASHRPSLNKTQSLVRDVILTIDLEYAEELSLQQLADRFYIDRYYLCHRFKEVTGVSVVEYLQYRRVLEAQKKLINSQQSIVDICYACGFHNLQHFYRVFRKFSGFTPGQYRPSKQH